MDLPPNLEVVSVLPVDLGHLFVCCPLCGDPSDVVGVGLGSKMIDGEETAELIPFGVMIFQCNDALISPCLAVRAGHILNGLADGYVDLDLFTGLEECEEHGNSKTDTFDEEEN